MTDLNRRQHGLRRRRYLQRQIALLKAELKGTKTAGAVLHAGEAMANDPAFTLRNVEKEGRAPKAIEEHYDLFFNHSNDAIFIHPFSSQGPLEKFELVNQTACVRLGYTRDEMLQLSPTNIDGPESESTRAAAIQELVQKQDCTFETMHRKKNGELIPVEVSARVLRVGGRPMVISIARDISQRKHAERTIVERERYLQTILQTMADGFWVVDTEGNIIEANAAYCRMSGYTRAELITLKIGDIDAVEAPSMSAERIARIVEIGAELFVTRHRRKDDSIFDVEISVSYLNSNGGKLICFCRDITTRRKAESEREKLLSAIEQAGEVVVITDTEGTIEYVNPAFEHTTGYTRMEAIGQNPRILKSGKQDNSFYSTLWKTILRGDTFHGRMVNRRKDGTLYTEEASISPVKNASGKIVNYVAVKRDISDQLILERQFLQAQKMESVGQLAGGVAHDFNNKLGVILGNVDMVMDAVDPSEPIYEYLSEIHKAAGHSADLTRQLLAFARKQTIAPKPIDLNETIVSMLGILRRLIGENIQLAWIPGSHLWQVNMDPSQIDQILANLCVNARDAISGIGSIIIETSNVTIGQDYCDTHEGFRTGRFVKLTVSDDGCGMSREIRERLFEPFFTTKDVGKGTGLGLSTVYGIIKQNNGFINVYSESAKGTTFTAYLPCLTGNDVQESNVELHQPLLNGDETLLIVEDDTAFLKLTSNLLKKRGYRIITAKIPSEAIRLAAEHEGRIHLLITDVVMPGMNGKELSEHIKSIHAGLKVLYLSGYTANVIAHHGVLDQGVNFIQKPFRSEKLAAKVRDVLDQQGAWEAA
jgi:two-component system, cell cycle sensor histidine kinase and response regulator CckA